ncbi:MAG: hypothetical protein IJT94_06260, partial [Oscillibacter sp.]|nr:hypothetical protein [Oscillibacter sp.]
MPEEGEAREPVIRTPVFDRISRREADMAARFPGKTESQPSLEDALRLFGIEPTRRRTPVRVETDHTAISRLDLPVLTDDSVPADAPPEATAPGYEAIFSREAESDFVSAGKEADNSGPLEREKPIEEPHIYKQSKESRESETYEAANTHAEPEIKEELESRQEPESRQEVWQEPGADRTPPVQEEAIEKSPHDEDDEWDEELQNRPTGPEEEIRAALVTELLSAIAEDQRERLAKTRRETAGTDALSATEPAAAPAAGPGVAAGAETENDTKSDTKNGTDPRRPVGVVIPLWGVDGRTPPASMESEDESDSGASASGGGVPVYDHIAIGKPTIAAAEEKRRTFSRRGTGVDSAGQRSPFGRGVPELKIGPADGVEGAKSVLERLLSQREAVRDAGARETESKRPDRASVATATGTAAEPQKEPRGARANAFLRELLTGEKPKPDEAGGSDAARKQNAPPARYIAATLAVALMLLGVVYVTRQRNDSETLSRLQSDLDAAQEIQAHQEQIISLQKAQDELQKQLDEAQGSLEGQDTRSQAQQEMNQALLYLYVIEMEYEVGRYEDCKEAVEQFDASGRVDMLPT